MTHQRVTNALGQSDSIDLSLGLALQLSDLCLSQGNILGP